MQENSEIKVAYLPAIGVVDGKADYFWSDNVRSLDTIDTILFHSMYNPKVEGDAQYSAEACRDLLNSLGVSTHYFIDRLGAIFQSVDEVRLAWQAGKSQMPQPDGRTNVNSFSVGVELIGNEHDGFTQDQLNALVGLVAQIMHRLPIENILGHSDVSTAEVRPDPKTDPWNFDWEIFNTLLFFEIGKEKYDGLKMVGGE
jgi:N-acetyl-anhydromuramyl-L-alanine amidase AmpD